jgi:hypothetical protein
MGKSSRVCRSTAKLARTDEEADIPISATVWTNKQLAFIDTAEGIAC